MAGLWSVVSFSIETTTPDRSTDTLFANGLMQVPVVISILARYEENGIPPIHCEGWDIATDANEFDHVMLGRVSEAESPTAGTAKVGGVSDGQNIIFWVSTLEVEHKNIAASIREPSGDDAHTGVASKFNSRVIITSVAPPRVTIDDVETTRSPESLEAWIDNPQILCVQHNWYVTGKRHELRKSLPHGYCTGSNDCGNMNDPGLLYCYSWDVRRRENPVFGHYTWPMGPQEERRVGLINKRLDFTAHINKRRNAQTLTLIEFDHHPELFRQTWHNYAPWFEVWDRYGNNRGFQATIDPYNSFQVSLREYQGAIDSEANPDDAKLEG
ncbi:hypothetical protein A0O28_0104990 [Trichoderma guizhouense]|uniref:Uncharacterized protein n=1 Tax=Trichoderma guizhouense TaxID=1491466 RepID=A0A1T3CQD5_9HYPO|nr:hypothetical protein A0O28_0104990 [Trichoderma guizhouense]